MEYTNSKLAHEIKSRGFNAADFADDISAANWVMAALDPADSAGQNGAVLGIPDHSDQPSTVIAWRQLEQLAPNEALGLTSSDTWEFDMITMEGPYILAAGQMRKTGTPSTYWNFWIVNSMFNFNPDGPNQGPGPRLQLDAEGNLTVIGEGVQTNWQQNVAWYRPIWSSMTAEFVGASLTDQGTIATAQMPNIWTTAPLSNVIAASVPATTSPLLAFARGTSVSLAQLGTSSTHNTATTLDESTGVPKIDTIMMIAPGSRTWKASKGAYIPLRYQQPSLLYENSAALGSITAVYHPWNMNGVAHGPAVGGDTMPPGFQPVLDNSAGTPIVGTLSNLMRVGAVCAKGLASTTTFSLCFRNAYEILPPPAAPWSANLTPSCKPCDKAVEAYFRLRHELPDAFEASWNREGTLKKMVGSLASTLTGVNKPTAKDGEASPTGGKTRGIKKIAAKVIAPTGSDAANSKRPIVAAVKARRGKKGVQ